MVQEGVIQTTVKGHQGILGEEIEGVGLLDGIPALINIRERGTLGAPVLEAVTTGHIHAGEQGFEFLFVIEIGIDEAVGFGHRVLVVDSATGPNSSGVGINHHRSRAG